MSTTGAEALRRPQLHSAVHRGQLPGGAPPPAIPFLHGSVWPQSRPTTQYLFLALAQHLGGACHLVDT
jgi:hypothetical protein